MVYKDCSICGGRGLVVDYEKIYKTSPSNIAYGDKRCPECNGSGQIYIEEPKRNNFTSPNNHKGSSKSASSSGKKEQTVQGVVGGIGFIAGAILSYHHFESYVFSIISGLLMAYLSAKWYKAVIIIMLIVLIIYALA